MAAGNNYSLTQLIKQRNEGMIQDKDGNWIGDGNVRDWYFIEVKWGAYPIQKWLDSNDESHADEIALINSGSEAKLGSLIITLGDELIDSLVAANIIDAVTHDPVAPADNSAQDLLN